MKKQIVAIAIITSLAMATTATANWNRGGGRGYGSCCQNQQQYQQLDQATQDKISQFFDENKSLQKQIVMKQAEKRALMRTDNPDPKLAARVAGELFDLRTEMRDKAKSAGVDQYVGSGRMGLGRMGKGSGPHGGGGGKGNRWK